MVYGAEAGGAAIAAAIVQAVKASGAIVQVEPADFNILISKIDKPLVVQAQRGVLKTKYQYLMGYRGLVFYTESPTPLMLPGDTELIAAKKIWVPK